LARDLLAHYPQLRTAAATPLQEAEGVEDFRGVAFHAEVFGALDVAAKRGAEEQDGDAVLFAGRMNDDGLAVDHRLGGVVEVGLEKSGAALNAVDSDCGAL